MWNSHFQRITRKTICLPLFPLLCLIGITAFISADAHAKSASEVFEVASKSTVVVLGYDGKGKVSSLGSGVVMPDGSVATNCHVIEKAARLEIRYQKRQYRAAKRYTDWDRDTCSLTVKGLNAPAVRLGATRRLKVGTRVYAIGAPQGLELTLSEGIVSGLREIEGGQYIQTTAPISPGSSGGGLFDGEGRLLGLTTFYLAKGQNLNFTLPVEWISELPKRQTITARKTIRTVDWYNKAFELESKKDWQGLIAHCQRWVAAEPEEVSAWSYLGIAYDTSGQTARAIKCYQKALTIDPEFVEAWYNLGLAYDTSGQTSQAIKCYQKALTIDPEFVEAWYNLGLAYDTSGQTARAMECFQKALSINPEDTKAWNSLGIVYYATSGQTARAIECFQKALSINPEDTLAWYNLGTVYGGLGQTARAIECFQKALSINPEYGKAWYNLGIAYRRSGQTSQVTKVYRRLKSLDPKLAEKFFKKIVLP